MSITVTEKAVSEIKRIIAEQSLTQDKVALRVRVVGSGCSGFMTKLDLDEVFDEAKDEMFETDGIKVAVDKRSIIYIQGATVDFHDSIDKRGFVVSNPNAVSRCGCNQSFSM